MAYTDLLALIGRDTPLKRTCARHGGEYSGPCPLCRAGTDRFKVWPQLQRWACLGPEAGRNGCGRSGDAIQYLRERDGLSYREACERLGIDPGIPPPHKHGAHRRAPPAPALHGEAYAALRPGVEALAPPNPTWRAHGSGWAARCAALLWEPKGARARDYLHKRGLFDGVLRSFNVGYNPQDTWEDHEQWGLARPDGNGDQGRNKVWIPRGITLPWYVDGQLWRLNVRRPLTPSRIARGEAKYIGPAGFSNALYNAGSVRSGRPVVLVEGEIDALTIVQACGEQAAAVATGSTGGGRRSAWVAKLALAPLVLLAFDADKFGADGSPGAGDRAAAWWLGVLPNAQRWRPLLHDVNSLPDPEDVRGWVMCGLERARHPAA
jgi:DNA primase